MITPDGNICDLCHGKDSLHRIGAMGHECDQCRKDQRWVVVGHSSLKGWKTHIYRAGDGVCLCGSDLKFNQPVPVKEEIPSCKRCQKIGYVNSDDLTRIVAAASGKRVVWRDDA